MAPVKLKVFQRPPVDINLTVYPKESASHDTPSPGTSDSEYRPSLINIIKQKKRVARERKIKPNILVEFVKCRPEGGCRCPLCYYAYNPAEGAKYIVVEHIEDHVHVVDLKCKFENQ